MPSVSRATRAAAAASIKPVATRLAMEVLYHLRACGAVGATADEASVSLGMMLHTTSARFNELAAKGLISETGARRKTRSGRSAAVWKATSVIVRTPMAAAP